MKQPNTSSSAETAKQIKELIKEPFNIRHFDKLTNAGERQDAKRLDELRRIFIKLIADGELQLSPSSSLLGESADDISNVRVQWNMWLSNQYSKFVDQLCDRIRLLGRKHALRTFCGLIASSPISITGNTSSSSSLVMNIDQKLVFRLVEALCVRYSTNKDQLREQKRKYDTDIDLRIDESMINLFQSEFIRPYRDAQYFTLSAIHELILKIPLAKEYKVNEDDSNKTKAAIVAENILTLLMQVNIAKSQEELDNGSYLIQPPSSPENPQLSTLSTKEVKDESNEDEGFDSDEETDSSDSDNESAPSETSGNKTLKKKKINPSTLIKSSGIRRKKRRKGDSRLYFQVLSRHRRLLGETWLSCLNLSYMSIKAHKRALQYLPKNILPVIRNPLRLADYMTKSYGMGGMTAILALNGLFLLMTKHGLEYPQFYASLYALIGPKIFYAKHRNQFFQLLTICLSKSQMLPAYVIAAFCKRLCHSALSAPPSGALFTLALVSNLLRKHNECACLIHRGGGSNVEDVFDMETDDPSKCRAIESSLWELSAFEKHYHPAVSALAKACGRESEKTPLHDMDDFLLHTYKSLFEQENKRRSKKIPLTFTEPKSLFIADDVFSKILCVPSNS